MAAFGARPSLLGGPAKIGSPKPERSLAPGSGAVASCPKPDASVAPHAINRIITRRSLDGQLLALVSGLASRTKLARSSAGRTALKPHKGPRQTRMRSSYREY